MLVPPDDRNQSLSAIGYLVCATVCGRSLLSMACSITDRQVLAIASKSKEARRTMSFDSFALLARVAGPAALIDILEPLKELMKTTVTLKVWRMPGDVASECC